MSRTFSHSSQDEGGAREGLTRNGPGGPTARLADKIYNSGLPALSGFLDDSGWPASAGGVADGTTARVPVYAIDGVAEHFYAETAQEHWDLRDDFVGLAPSHPRLFLETVRPSRVVSAEHGTTSAAALPDAWGSRIESIGLGDLRRALAAGGLIDEAERRRREYLGRLSAALGADPGAVLRALRSSDPLAAARRLGGAERAYLAAALAHPLGPGLGRPDEGEGWLVRATLVAEVAGVVLPPQAAVALRLDASGRVVPPAQAQRLSGTGGIIPAGDDRGEAILLLLYPALLALPRLDRAEEAVGPAGPQPLQPRTEGRVCRS